MISFSKIGKYGRLGNQLFQYSMLFGLRNKIEKISSNNKMTAPIFISNYEPEIFKVFNIKTSLSRPQNYKNNLRYIEEKFNFIPNLEKLDYNKNNIDFEGYFQTDKYWLHCEKELIKHLEFSSNVKNKIINYDLNNVCSLHVRRGDYLNLADYHVNLGIDYYTKAISIMTEKSINKFLVFSDDIAWCKENFTQFQNKDVEINFSENNTTGEDLFLMSKCNFHIIANSSFSWWGSTLGQSKLTISPKNWFGPKINHDTSDLYRENWIII